jgi:hypothetical protein
MNSQIVDLILPERYNKEKAKQNVLFKYVENFEATTLDFAIWFAAASQNYIVELEEIENSQPKYDREFWEQVIELNKETLNIIGWRLETNDKYVGFECRGEIDYTPNFNFHEIDLINKQYRLLQEIYYSRLEGANDNLCH